MVEYDRKNLERNYVHPDEQRLWEEFRYKSIDPATPLFVDLQACARRTGTHAQQARDMLRTWENDGIAEPISNQNYNRGAVTLIGYMTVDPRWPAKEKNISDADRERYNGIQE